MDILQNKTNCMTVVIVKIITFSLTMLQIGVNWKKKTHLIFSLNWPYWDTSHQYKNIKGLNRRTIYRTFKAINKNKGIQRRPESGRKSSISKSTFGIIKKCLEIDNGLSTYEMSNKIFAEKGVKISSEAIRRY